MRGSGFDSSIREFRIGSRGIEVERSSDTAEAILTGAASAPEIGRGRSAAEHGGTRR
jgi:hypothetical protein